MFSRYLSCLLNSVMLREANVAGNPDESNLGVDRVEGKSHEKNLLYERVCIRVVDKKVDSKWKSNFPSGGSLER